MTAEFGEILQQAGPQALPRQLEKTEGTDTADLDAGAILAHGIAQPPTDTSPCAQ